jgi:hypothetical protein
MSDIPPEPPAPAAAQDSSAATAQDRQPSTRKLVRQVLPLFLVGIITVAVARQLSNAIGELDATNVKLDKVNGELDASQIELELKRQQLDASAQDLDATMQSLIEVRGKLKEERDALLLLQTSPVEEVIAAVRKKYAGRSPADICAAFERSGDEQSRFGDRDGAEKLYQEAVQQDPSCAGALIKLAILLSKHVNPEKRKLAIPYLERAAKVGDAERKGYALYNLVNVRMLTPEGLAEADRYAEMLRDKSVRQPSGTEALLAQLKQRCEKVPGTCKPGVSSTKVVAAQLGTRFQEGGFALDSPVQLPAGTKFGVVARGRVKTDSPVRNSDAPYWIVLRLEVAGCSPVRQERKRGPESGYEFDLSAGNCTAVAGGRSKIVVEHCQDGNPKQTCVFADDFSITLRPEP